MKKPAQVSRLAWSWQQWRSPQHTSSCHHGWGLTLGPATSLSKNYSKCRILIFEILAFFTNFCPFKTDLSGNTVWPQASDFQKLAKIDLFWASYIKCKGSSLRSQCWMKLFLWFSNTVHYLRTTKCSEEYNGQKLKDFHCYFCSWLKNLIFWP